MHRPLFGLLLLFLVSGCQKSDTETLTRLGRKLADRGHTALTDLRCRVGIDLDWKPAPSEPSLDERVRLRLRYDRDLAEIPLEIKLHGTEVELLGKVRNPDHKRRAVELAESTRGVEIVTDHIQVDEPMPEPPPMPEQKMDNIG